MKIKAIALYDFAGNADADEISFQAGEILTITSMHSDDGWWEGISASGQKGVFPELYVELMPPHDEAEADLQSPDDRIPTPPHFFPESPLPPSIENQQTAKRPPLFSGVPDVPATPPPESSAHRLSTSGAMAVQLAAKLKEAHVSPMPRTVSNADSVWSNGGISNSSYQDGPEGDINLASGDNSLLEDSRQTGGPPLRRSLNRFCHFVASGAEAFLLRDRPEEDVHVLEGRSSISLASCGPKWSEESSVDKYDISLLRFENKSKFAGTKHYVAYEIREENSNSTVWRRYKHFLWLHNILASKFATLCLPPLPEKQAQGRFADEFVEQRRRALERYLRRLSRHPVVRDSTVFHLFITCADERAWKFGKRASEKDPIQGSRFLQTVDVLNNVVPEDGDAEQTSAFAKFVRSMKLNDEALIEAHSGFIYAAPTFQHVYSRMSFALRRLIKGSPKDKSTTNTDGHWCWKNECEQCKKLTDVIEDISVAMKEVSTFWESNAQESCVPFMEQLREYDGMIDSMNIAVDLHDKTAVKLRDAKKVSIERPVDPEALDSVTGRCSTLFNLSLAEINHFHDERVTDYSAIMSSFLDSQIDFHEKMLEKFRDTRHRIQ